MSTTVCSNGTGVRQRLADRARVVKRLRLTELDAPQVALQEAPLLWAFGQHLLIPETEVHGAGRSGLRLVMVVDDSCADSYALSCRQ